MARPRFDRSRPRPTGPRTNERIRVPEVRVIGAKGDQLGVITTSEAKRIAREANLDLVEVNPKANPPVCKIMDFGRFKYEEKKKQNEAKKRQKVVELKEVKLRPKTDDHDLDVKIRHVRRFLEEGNKVKITVRFRGREITHPQTAERQIVAILEAVMDMGSLEQTARMEGRTMTAIVAPKVRTQMRRAAVEQPEESESEGAEAEQASPEAGEQASPEA